MQLDWWSVPLAFVIACWFVFAAIFIFRKRPPASGQTERKRDSMSLVAVLLQGSGYSLVWALKRPSHTPLLSASAEPLLSIVAMSIAVISIWLVTVSVRTLGKQWAFAARVVEGHTLITDGPYAAVRNPIYTGMFGMLFATGLVVSRWPALLAATILFLAGTMWRITLEERLLREQFGEQFDAYCKSVPALLPRIPH